MYMQNYAEYNFVYVNWCYYKINFVQTVWVTDPFKVCKCNKFTTIFIQFNPNGVYLTHVKYIYTTLTNELSRWSNFSTLSEVFDFDETTVIYVKR